MLYFIIALLSFVAGFVTHNYFSNKVSSAVSAALADLKEASNRIESKFEPTPVTQVTEPVSDPSPVTPVSNPS